MVLSWRAGLCLRDKRSLRPDLARTHETAYQRSFTGMPLLRLAVTKRIGRRAMKEEGQRGRTGKTWIWRC